MNNRKWMGLATVTVCAILPLRLYAQTPKSPYLQTVRGLPTKKKGGGERKPTDAWWLWFVPWEWEREVVPMAAPAAGSLTYQLMAPRWGVAPWLYQNAPSSGLFTERLQGIPDGRIGGSSIVTQDPPDSEQGGRTLESVNGISAGPSAPLVSDPAFLNAPINLFYIPPDDDSYNSGQYPGNPDDDGPANHPQKQARDVSKPEYFVAVGWQSADVYKDVDKTSEAGFPIAGNREGDDVDRTSVVYTKLGFSYAGFGGGVTYLDSTDSIRPRYSSLRRFLKDKPLPRSMLYNEVDLALNYSKELIPNLLEATAGFNAYLLPHTSFWGTDYAGEIYATLSWTRIPYLRPSATYSDFLSSADQLRGRFLELRVDTINVFNYRSSVLQAELNPYVSAGIDDNLIGDGVGWTAVDVGMRLPIYLCNRHIVMTANGNYGFPLSPNHFHTDLSKVGIWGGISLTLTY